MSDDFCFKHCVYTSEYYKRKNSLILSAFVNDKPTDTIEFCLDNMKVIQCRGKANSASKNSTRILNLFERHTHEISMAM